MRANGAARAARMSDSTVQLTLALIVVLLLLGAAGGGSLALLQYAMRQPTAADIAQRVCTAYQTQNYDLLVAQIDPTPIPPNNLSDFASARSVLVAQLRSLDASAGQVTSCSQKCLTYPGTAPNPNQQQCAFVMTRSRTPAKPFNTLMTLVHGSNAGWRVARNSNFIGSQA